MLLNQHESIERDQCVKILCTCISLPRPAHLIRPHDHGTVHGSCEQLQAGPCVHAVAGWGRTPLHTVEPILMACGHEDVLSKSMQRNRWKKRPMSTQTLGCKQEGGHYLAMAGKYGCPRHSWCNTVRCLVCFYRAMLASHCGHEKYWTHADCL